MFLLREALIEGNKMEVTLSPMFSESVVVFHPEPNLEKLLGLISAKEQFGSLMLKTESTESGRT